VLSRLITGPFAFAVAGIADVAIYAVRSLAARRGRHRSSARAC
jgi:hypothetical protein